MKPNREEVLFALALEKPAVKRAALLDMMCEGDAALHQRLESLLGAHEQPETLLATQVEAARRTIKLDLADAPDEALVAPSGPGGRQRKFPAPRNHSPLQIPRMSDTTFTRTSGAIMLLAETRLPGFSSALQPPPNHTTLCTPPATPLVLTA